MYSRETDIEKIKAAAESGDPKAAFNLGWCYYIGSGVVQNKTEAWKWYAKAASAGVPEAREIVRILEAEAQRDLELKALRSEASPSPRIRPAAWFAIVPIAFACIGSIAVLLHVLDHQSTVTEPDAMEGRADAGQEEAISEDLKATSGVARSREVVPMEQGPAGPSVAVESGTQVNQPTDSKRAAGPLVDFNELSKRAMKWLEDGNDASGTNQPTKGTDQKHRQE